MSQTVTIDLQEFIDEEGGDLTDRIVSAAARCLVTDLNSSTRDAVKRHAEQGIEIRLAVMLDEFFGRTFTATDEWGDPRVGSKPKTMGEVVRGMIQECLQQKVNARGEKDYHGERTRLQWLIERAAENVIQTTLNSELKKATQEMTASLKGKLGKVFQDALIAAMKA